MQNHEDTLTRCEKNKVNFCLSLLFIRTFAMNGEGTFTRCEK